MKKLAISTKRPNGETLYFWYNRNNPNTWNAWSNSPSMAYDFSDTRKDVLETKFSNLRSEYLGLSDWKKEIITF